MSDVELEQPIVFFDGVCGLCSRFVDFTLKRDRAGRIRFAPLQGSTAARLLPPSDAQSLASVVFWKDGRATRHTTAVVGVLHEVGGLWSCVAAVLWIIPRPLRNLGYRVVASQRYRFFGKKETCRLPTPSERARFLD